LRALENFDAGRRLFERSRAKYLAQSRQIDLLTVLPYHSDCDILSTYRERACSQRFSNRATEKAAVPTFEKKGYGL